jgi:apolipoprotein N-acyltransferase
MRTLLMVAIGVVLAFVFDGIIARLRKRDVSRGAGGAELFLWVWVAVVSVDFWVGVEAGNGVMLELGVHLLIFALPSALAWYLARRRRGRHAATQ